MPTIPTNEHHTRSNLRSVKPRLPAGPLIEQSGQSLRSVAQHLGIDPANLCRPLSINQADRYACRLGLHPMSIWGDDWLTDTDD